MYYTGAAITKIVTEGYEFVFQEIQGTTSATDAGTYHLKLVLADGFKWSDDTSDVFDEDWKILKATNYITNLRIDNWRIGNPESEPTCEHEFGDAIYEYSTSKNGTYSTTKPTAAGKYFLRARIAGTDNYDGVASVYADSPFEILHAQESPTETLGMTAKIVIRETISAGEATNTLVAVVTDPEPDGVTICFWTKPIGFSSEKQLMVSIGKDNDNKDLRLYYSIKSPVYGLYLLGNKGGAESDNIIGYESEFRDNIGKWTFISIAFHKEIKGDDNKVFFPKMIKFEINTDSIAADPTKIGDNPEFSKIKVSSGYFGLFVGIKYYNEYLIQSIAYETTNQPNLIDPFSIPKLIKADGEESIALTCSSQKYKGDDCVPDEPPDVGLFLNTCNLFKDTLTTENSCMNSCTGGGWTRCTCSSLNHNSQMIFNNNNKNLCRPLEYINFSKIKDLTISNLGAAHTERKFTMQFWMYAYAYNEGVFQGITFDWEGHNKIEVKLQSDNSYKFFCSANGKTLSAPIEISKWYFLSCSVDYFEN